MGATIDKHRYYLPENIRNHIDYITPGVKDHVFKRKLEGGKKAKRAVATYGQAPYVSPVQASAHIDAAININCSNYVVSADCIRALYNMPALNLNKKKDPTNAIG